MNGSAASTSAAQPCGTCPRCHGTLYAGLTHHCGTSVRLPVQQSVCAPVYDKATGDLLGYA